LQDGSLLTTGFSKYIYYYKTAFMARSASIQIMSPKIDTTKDCCPHW